MGANPGGVVGGLSVQLRPNSWIVEDVRAIRGFTLKQVAVDEESNSLGRLRSVWTVDL